jgi:uncharacterized membrane protein YdjX (TVP38/TMEM64 family)
MNKPLVRIFLILALIGTILVAGKLSGATEWLNLDNVTRAIRASGGWGVLLFIGLFTAGSFLQIPAMLFVLTSILVFGPVQGLLLGYVAVVLAMTINFLVIRTVGSRVLHEIKNPRLQKALQRLDSNPLSTVILLRLVLWASPALNYTLAMTSVKPKDYILGAAVGIIIPILIFGGSVHFFQEMIVSIVR